MLIYCFGINCNFNDDDWEVVIAFLSVITSSIYVECNIQACHYSYVTMEGCIYLQDRIEIKHQREMADEMAEVSVLLIFMLKQYIYIYIYIYIFINLYLYCYASVAC